MNTIEQDPETVTRAAEQWRQLAARDVVPGLTILSPHDNRTRWYVDSVTTERSEVTHMSVRATAYAPESERISVHPHRLVYVLGLADAFVVWRPNVTPAEAQQVVDTVEATEHDRELVQQAIDAAEHKLIGPVTVNPMMSGDFQICTREFEFIVRHDSPDSVAISNLQIREDGDEHRGYLGDVALQDLMCFVGHYLARKYR
jgi:hypothetical protein